MPEEKSSTPSNSPQKDERELGATPPNAKLDNFYPPIPQIAGDNNIVTINPWDASIEAEARARLEANTKIYHEDIGRITGIQNSILSLVALVLIAIVVFIGGSVYTFHAHVESSAPVMLKILETQASVSDKNTGAALKTTIPASAPEKAADPTAVGLIISEMKWLTQMSAGIVLSLIISASAIVFALLQLAGKLTPIRFTDNHAGNNKNTAKDSGQSEEKDQITISLPSIEYIKGCGKVFSEFIESDSGKSLWGWVKSFFQSDKDKPK